MSGTHRRLMLVLAVETVAVDIVGSDRGSGLNPTCVADGSRGRRHTCGL